MTDDTGEGLVGEKTRHHPACMNDLVRHYFLRFGASVQFSIPKYTTVGASSYRPISVPTDFWFLVRMFAGTSGSGKARYDTQGCDRIVSTVSADET